MEKLRMTKTLDCVPCRVGASRRETKEQRGKMSSYLAPVHVIGGNGGNSFSYDRSLNGRVLKRIGVWAGEYTLRGVRVWMSGSDSSTLFGASTGSYKEYTFTEGERITRLSLWGNGVGTRTGGIKFETSTRGSFFHKMTGRELQTEYPIEVASGLCVGLVGSAGADIDCLGFLFLRSIKHARMLNVSYPTLALESAGIIPVTLDAYHDSNDSASVTKNWAFSGERTVTKSSSWTLTAGIEIHATMSVEAKIPLVADVGAKFGWKLSVTGGYTTTHEEKQTLKWSQSGTLQPMQRISIQATTRKGTITLPYQGTMEITLENGAMFTYPISSMYTGMDYTSVEITSTGSRAMDGVQFKATDQHTHEEHGHVEPRTQVHAGHQNVQPSKEVQECKLLFIE